MMGKSFSFILRCCMIWILQMEYVKIPSAKADGFSREAVYTTTRDPKLLVTPHCVTRASRVTCTQTVSSYSMMEFNKWKRLKQSRFIPDLKCWVFSRQWIKEKELQMAASIGRFYEFLWNMYDHMDVYGSDIQTDNHSLGVVIEEFEERFKEILIKKENE